MHKNEKTNRFFGGQSRRDFMRGLSAAGLGLAMVPIARQPAHAGDISYFTWAGYDVPEFYPSYVESHGMPDVTIFASEDEALQKVRVGFAPDFVHPCIYDIPRWRDSGVLQELDPGRMAHWDDLFPALKSVSGVADDGPVLFVPIDWGNGSIVYRTDMLDLPEESWSILFDDEYAGRVAMWNAIDGAVNAAALVAGAEDPFNMTDAELDRVRDLLRKQRDVVRFYWDDPTQAEQAIASGELVAAYVWNYSVVALKSQGIPVKYMRPKEGILTWVCGLVRLSDGGGDDQAAYDFIDGITSVETGEFLVESYGIGHSNMRSFDNLSAETLDLMGLPDDPALMFSDTIVLTPMDPAVREKYVRIFEEIKAGG